MKNTVYLLILSTIILTGCNKNNTAPMSNGNRSIVHYDGFSTHRNISSSYKNLENWNMTKNASTYSYTKHFNNTTWNNGMYNYNLDSLTFNLGSNTYIMFFQCGLAKANSVCGPSPVGETSNQRQVSEIFTFHNNGTDQITKISQIFLNPVTNNVTSYLQYDYTYETVAINSGSYLRIKSILVSQAPNGNTATNPIDEMVFTYDNTTYQITRIDYFDIDPTTSARNLTAYYLFSGYDGKYNPFYLDLTVFTTNAAGFYGDVPALSYWLKENPAKVEFYSASNVLQDTWNFTYTYDSDDYPAQLSFLDGTTQVDLTFNYQ